MTDGVFANFDDPNSTGIVTFAFDINDSAQMVGRYVNASGDNGFIASTPEPSTFYPSAAVCGALAIIAARFRRGIET